jgi:S-adenosylmethionine uptake transporter
MVLAMASFIVNDTCVKAIGSTLPLGEIIMIRGSLAFCLIAMVCAHQGVLDKLPQAFSRIVIFRSLIDVAVTLMFLVALIHMEIANLTAILQSVPLAVAILSVLFLGERVGIRRSTAIIAGFIGVLLVVQPSPANFTAYEALALIIVVALAIRDVLTKRIPAHVPIFIVALANAGYVSLGGVMLGLYQGFVWPAPWQWALMCSASIVLASGYLLMVATLRSGDLSATAPFRYSNVVFAILLGMVFFAEFPNLEAYLGMALIVAAGLYTAHRDVITRRRDGT